MATCCNFCTSEQAVPSPICPPLGLGFVLVWSPYFRQKFCRLYGLCGSRNYRRIGRRTTDVKVKSGNAGPKLHWPVWEESGFSALPSDREILLFVARTNIYEMAVKSCFWSP